MAARDEGRETARSIVCELMSLRWLQEREDIPRKRSGFDSGHPSCYLPTSVNTFCELIEVEARRLFFFC